MKRNAFARSLVFAAGAAAAWPAFALAVQPFTGGRGAIALYLVASAAAYVAVLAPTLVRGAAAAALAAGITGAYAAVARDPFAVALAAAIAIGLARSGLLHRASPARALAVEAILLGGGLALAGFLATPGILGVALAIWGFFLVQSAFPAIGGVRPSGAEAERGDAFERAHRRALALLEEA
jgi:hypothetical protein